MTERSSPPEAPRDPRELPLYRLTEAAQYLRIPLSTLRGWIVGWDYRTKGGTRRAVPLLRPPDGARPDKLLSFYNLVECHILASLRRLHRIPMHKVRKAIRRATEGKKGARHPLLRARLAAEGADLLIDRGGGQEDQDGQCVFFFAVERPVGRIEWDPSGALPIRLYPWVSGDDPKAAPRIEIDPERASGRPVIAGTAIPTAVVAARHRAGESVAALAGEYGLDPSIIEDALRCEIRRAA
jgi:uncharacterized protein (DUF433 family)